MYEKSSTNIKFATKILARTFGKGNAWKPKIARPQTFKSNPSPPPSPRSNFIACRPKAALLFWFLVILDVVCRYLSLFLSYINTKIGKNRC